MKNLLALFVLIFFIFTGSLRGGPNDKITGKIIIFHAGSLSVPFEAMKREFQKNNISIEILLEASGSQQAARKISDLKKPCDIMASADYRVIDKLLIPIYADWNIQFATNQLVLCYTGMSKHYGEINSNNWHEIIQKKDVIWGHSDPNLDPCGYRSLMVLQLAEKYYKVPGLYKNIISNRPIENIRPKSVELLSLLETGNMDYAWEYLSVAVQHKLKYIALPDEINLGNSRFNANYKNAVVTVTGEKPGTTMDMTGESCVYGIALIKDAPNSAAAIKFLEYMLDPAGGLKIFREMAQPPVSPCKVADQKTVKTIPFELQKYINKK